MGKKILFFDMDGVLVNFQSGIDKLDEHTLKKYGKDVDEVPGIFALMNPVPGAIDAVHTLAKHYDIYILSTAPWKNPTALNDKLKWVKDHFGEKDGTPFYKRLVFTHHKNLCHGDFLIDDRPDKCGVNKFTGEVIPFGSERFPNWDIVVKYLVEKSK